MNTNTAPSAWKVIIKMIFYSPVHWIVNLAAMLVLMGCGLIPGILLKAFFNLLDGSGGMSLGLIIALFYISEIGVVTGMLGLIKTSVPFFIRSLTLLRKNMILGIFKKPGAQALKDSPGEAISRFRGDTFEIPLFSLWLNDIQGLAYAGFVALGFMIAINPRITLFSVLPFILVGLISAAATNRIDRYRRASRRATGIVLGFISELFTSVQAVQASCAEKTVLHQFKKLNEERGKLTIKDRLFNEILHALFHSAVNIGIGVILILAARSIRDGIFTIGDFALFTMYLGYISEMSTFGGLLIARYKQIAVSVQRIHELMGSSEKNALYRASKIYYHDDQPETEEVRHGTPLKEILVSGVGYSFPGSSFGLKDISFNLKKNSFSVITGRIGSGKTTLLRVILGLRPKDKGKILWNGDVVEDPARFFVPPVCAYTPQVPRLFSQSLKENILFGLHRKEKEIYSCIRNAVLEEDIDSLESGIDTIVGTRGVKLSGGQIQRSAVARMLVRFPQLIVLDDVSSALDVETEEQLWNRIFALENSTCIAVSHRKQTLLRADQIIVLKDGQIEGCGTLKELLENCDELKHIWYSHDD